MILVGNSNNVVITGNNSFIIIGGPITKSLLQSTGNSIEDNCYTFIKNCKSLSV
jgi:hypothetical protein